MSPRQHKIRKPRSNDTPPGRVAPSHRGNMTCTCKTCGQQIPVKSTDTQITELVDEEGGAPEHATAPGNRKAEGEGGGQWQPIRGTTDRVDRGTDMCDRGGRHCGHAPPPPLVQRVDYAWHARCGGMERLPHAKSISNVARSQGSGARAKWDAHVLMQWLVHLSCVCLQSVATVCPRLRRCSCCVLTPVCPPFPGSYCSASCCNACCAYNDIQCRTVF